MIAEDPPEILEEAHPLPLPLVHPSPSTRDPIIPSFYHPTGKRPLRQLQSESVTVCVPLLDITTVCLSCCLQNDLPSNFQNLHSGRDADARFLNPSRSSPRKIVPDAWPAAE